MRVYLGQWKPEFYTEPKPGKIKAKKPVFTSDDDLNMVYPGHTLSVNYTLGPADIDDMSLIKWYRDKDGKVVERFPESKRSPNYKYRTNWITFYK
jgi:hypothetical protein